MPRTHKTLAKQNLSKLPVLIEDTGVESTYFNIKQLPGVLTGGRNGFLITGTPFLKPGTEVLVELLDVNGNSIYVEAVRGIVEANARLVAIEIYQETPPGTALLSIVGTARTRVSDGTILTDAQTDKPNVRWQKKIIIEPKRNNQTPLRVKLQPQVLVQELLATGSLLSQSVYDVAPNYVLIPLNKNQKQIGYTIQNYSATPFASYQISPKITGSLLLETRQYISDIPFTTSSYQVISSDTASVDLPVRLLNVSKAFADTNITSSVTNQIVNISPLLNGSYAITSSAYSSSNTQYVQTITVVTSAVNYHYISQSITTNTTQSLSLAKVRIINLDTVTGEIFRVKTSNKSAGSQLDFAALADTQTTVGEILISSSVVINQREIPIGAFNSTNIIQSNWYSYLVTGSAVPDPTYYDYTVSSSLILNKNDEHILDAAYAVTTASNYFIGTKNNFPVFPTSEYTLALDAYVYTTSGAAAYTASQYTTDIYLTGTAIRTTNPLGQKIGTISTTNDLAYFKNQTFNFNVPLSGSVGVRIIPNNGFWEFANISLKVAEEFAFSPDEVTLIIPNQTKVNDSVLYKTEFFDINNNALGISAISSPTYFTGVSTTSQIITGSGGSGSAFPYYGDAVIYGTLTVSGTTTVQSLVETSTINKKENIRPIEPQLKILNNIIPSRFTWKDSKKEDIGLIAESIESIYPELVERDTNGNVVGINYSKLTAVLIKASQEQQEIVKSLEDRLSKIEKDK